MNFWRIVAGSEAIVLLLAAWAIWRLLGVRLAQERELGRNAVTLRLYREMWTELDTQIGELFAQNDRLALKLADVAAQITPQDENPLAAVEPWLVGRSA
jgi:uncharacterized membrane protein (DUF2068 family)